MNLIEHIKNIIKFRKTKAFGMNYREFMKNGVWGQTEETFSDKELDKFVKEKNDYLKTAIYSEFKQSLTNKTITNARKVDKLTNEKYDELAKKADENIRKNRIVSSENQKEMKLSSFSRRDDER